MTFEFVNKKTTFKLATLGYAFIVWFYNFDLINDGFLFHLVKAFVIFIILIVMALVAFTGFNLDLDKDKRVSLIKKSIFILLFIIFSTVFLSFFPLLSLYVKLFYTALVSFIFYFLLLAINVFIVSMEKGRGIPLVQPSRVVAFLGVLIIVFLGSTVIYKIGFFDRFLLLDLLAVKLPLFSLFFYLLFISVRWLIIGGYSSAGKFGIDLVRVNDALILTMVFMVETAFVLSFVPLEAYARALLLVGHTYMFLSFAQLYSRHMFTTRDVYKFIGILLLVYLVVFFI